MSHPQIGHTPRTLVVAQRCQAMDDIHAYQTMWEHAQALERELNDAQERLSKLGGENLRLTHQLAQQRNT